MYAELKQIIYKECKETKIVKNMSNTGKCQDCRDQDRITAKENKKKKRADRRKNFPEEHMIKDFETDLMKNYGMSLKSYHNLYETQKGVCAICETKESEFKRRLHVDHDHNTDKVRGLLCTRCNPGLGYFKDSVELIYKAVAYLEKFKK